MSKYKESLGIFEQHMLSDMQQDWEKATLIALLEEANIFEAMYATRKKTEFDGCALQLFYTILNRRLK